mmetsp:Transcript_25488/g.84286  ORF Transcript_25488/g.84286 Transcript_25488/m.84286 type:complete len:143 (+) Transcript_25488:187-615(+)
MRKVSDDPTSTPNRGVAEMIRQDLEASIQSISLQAVSCIETVQDCFNSIAKVPESFSSGVSSGVKALPLPGHGRKVVRLVKHDPNDAQRDINDPECWNWEKLGELQLKRAKTVGAERSTSSSNEPHNVMAQSSLPVKLIKNK